MNLCADGVINRRGKGKNYKKKERKKQIKKRCSELIKSGILRTEA